MARAHVSHYRYYAILLFPVFVLYAVFFAYPFAKAHFASGDGGDQSFFPRLYEELFLSPGSALPERIAKDGFEEHCLSKLSPLDRSVFANYYMDEGEYWKMNGAYSESSFVDTITLIREIDEEGLIPPESVAAFVESLKKASIERNMNDLNERVDTFLDTWPLSFSSSLAVQNGANGLFAVGEVKAILLASWGVRRFEPGIGGIAAVFALISFGGIILAALALARPFLSWPAARLQARNALFISCALSVPVAALAWNVMAPRLFSRLPGLDFRAGLALRTPALVAPVLALCAVAWIHLYITEKNDAADGAIKG